MTNTSANHYEPLRSAFGLNWRPSQILCLRLRNCKDRNFRCCGTDAISPSVRWNIPRRPNRRCHFFGAGRVRSRAPPTRVRTARTNVQRGYGPCMGLLSDAADADHLDHKSAAMTPSCLRARRFRRFVGTRSSVGPQANRRGNSAVTGRWQLTSSGSAGRLLVQVGTTMAHLPDGWRSAPIPPVHSRGVAFKPTYDRQGMRRRQSGRLRPASLGAAGWE